MRKKLQSSFRNDLKFDFINGKTGMAHNAMPVSVCFASAAAIAIIISTAVSAESTAATTKQNNQNDDNPQATIATPAIITIHNDEPPVILFETVSFGLSSFYVARSRRCRSAENFYLICLRKSGCLSQRPLPSLPFFCLIFLGLSENLKENLLFFPWPTDRNRISMPFGRG